MERSSASCTYHIQHNFFHHCLLLRCRGLRLRVCRRLGRTYPNILRIHVSLTTKTSHSHLHVLLWGILQSYKPRRVTLFVSITWPTIEKSVQPQDKCRLPQHLLSSFYQRILSIRMTKLCCSRVPSCDFCADSRFIIAYRFLASSSIGDKYTRVQCLGKWIFIYSRALSAHKRWDEHGRERKEVKKKSQIESRMRN